MYDTFDFWVTAFTWENVKIQSLQKQLEQIQWQLQQQEQHQKRREHDFKQTVDILDKTVAILKNKRLQPLMGPQPKNPPKPLESFNSIHLLPPKPTVSPSTDTWKPLDLPTLVLPTLLARNKQYSNLFFCVQLALPSSSLTEASAISKWIRDKFSLQQNRERNASYSTQNVHLRVHLTLAPSAPSLSPRSNVASSTKTRGLQAILFVPECPMNMFHTNPSSAAFANDKDRLKSLLSEIHPCSKVSLCILVYPSIADHAALECMDEDLIKRLVRTLGHVLIDRLGLKQYSTSLLAHWEIAWCTLTAVSGVDSVFDHESLSQAVQRLAQTSPVQPLMYHVSLPQLLAEEVGSCLDVLSRACSCIRYSDAQAVRKVCSDWVAHYNSHMQAVAKTLVQKGLSSDNDHAEAGAALSWPPDGYAELVGTEQGSTHFLGRAPVIPSSYWSTKAHKQLLKETMSFLCINGFDLLLSDISSSSPKTNFQACVKCLQSLASQYRQWHKRVLGLIHVLSKDQRKRKTVLEQCYKQSEAFACDAHTLLASQLRSVFVSSREQQNIDLDGKFGQCAGQWQKVIPRHWHGGR